jgi:ATP/ADP translocase
VIQNTPVTSTSALVRRLSIEPDEATIFAWGAATFFLIGWGAVSLTNVSDTLFLKRIGVDLLPAVFLVSSLLLVVTTFMAARLAARTPLLPLLRRTFLVLAAALLPLWLLVLADVRSAFVLLILAAKQFESIALLVFWATIGGQVHGRQAKRLYAPIVAGGTLGEMLGSFASGSVGHLFGVAALVPVAAGCFALAGVLSVPLGSRQAVRLVPAPKVAAGGGPRRPLHMLRPLWSESRLFRLLVVSALLSGVLGPMLYFQFSYVADLATQGSDPEQRLLHLYAQFRGYLNAGVLVLQLVGTSWLFRQIGVPLASTLSPLVYALGFLGLGLHLGLPAAVAAMAGANLQDHAIYDPAQKILVTLFPERVRPAATALIEGPVRRFGGALGNVVVLCTLALAAPLTVAYVGIPVAAGWLAVAIALWRVYPTVLLEVARAPRRAADRMVPLPAPIDRATLRVLESSLMDADPHRCRAACALVVEAPARRAVAALAHATRWAPDTTRPLLVAALHRALERAGRRLQAPEAAGQIEALLADRDRLAALERAHLLQAYAHLVPTLRPGSHAAGVLRRLLDDPAECVRVAATARLYDAGVQPAGTADIDALLAAAMLSDDGAVRHIALEELRVRLLAANGAESAPAALWEFRIAQLAAMLDTPEDRARAAEVLADLAARHGRRVAESADLVVPHAADPDPRVRAAVLRFAGYAQLEQQVPWIVGRLGADDEDEAAAAQEALRALGPTALAALLDALHFGKRAVRDAVLPILRDIHVDDARLRTLIDCEVDTIRRLLIRLHGLSAGPVSELVLQRIRERVDESVLATLHLLATLLHEERLATVGRQLMRFRSGRGRAVLIEALEALLPPAESARLMPLLDEGRGRAASAANALGRGLPSFDEALRETVADHDRLTLDFLAGAIDPRTAAGMDAPRAAQPAALAPGRQLGDDGEQRDATQEGRMLSRVEIVLHLRALDMFSSLTTRELNDLAEVVREEIHQPGSRIVSEGEFGDCMYLIVTGEVCVTRSQRVIARLGTGEFFGEMSLFDGERRSATVAATTRVHLLRLQRYDLFRLIDEQPALAIALCQTLSRRVRDLIEGSAQAEPGTTVSGPSPRQRNP